MSESDPNTSDSGTNGGAGQVVDQAIERELADSYLTYAMSTIVDRALPDVRDGLKPSQRRILVAMNDLNLSPGRKHSKCAGIVGETMKKYHPHGDQAIYPTLVNMAQEWKTRYLLVDKQGNFGSIDPDPPAAMRYTEARLHAHATELLDDLKLDTVDWQPNFDETVDEPKVLPSRFPNLLVNGSTGIAVGMACSIPPHNLGRSAMPLWPRSITRISNCETCWRSCLVLIFQQAALSVAVVASRMLMLQVAVVLRYAEKFITSRNPRARIYWWSRKFLIKLARMMASSEK